MAPFITTLNYFYDYVYFFEDIQRSFMKFSRKKRGYDSAANCTTPQTENYERKLKFVIGSKVTSVCWLVDLQLTSRISKWKSLTTLLAKNDSDDT